MRTSRELLTERRLPLSPPAMVQQISKSSSSTKASFPVIVKTLSPRLRYLYFTFLMSVFRRQRGECEGWKNDVLLYSHGKAWGSPKKWLRGSTIRMLGRRIGLEPDLEKLLGTNDLPLTTEEDEDDKDGRFAALVSEQIHAAVKDKLELPTQGVW